MSKKKPYLPLYARDWLSDPFVRSLSFMERGIYLELLLIDWLEGGIPADDEAVVDVLKSTESRTKRGRISDALRTLRGRYADKPRTLLGQFAHLSPCGTRRRHPRSVSPSSSSSSSSNTSPHTDGGGEPASPTAEKPPPGDDVETAWSAFRDLAAERHDVENPDALVREVRRRCRHPDEAGYRWWADRLTENGRSRRLVERLRAHTGRRLSSGSEVCQGGLVSLSGYEAPWSSLDEGTLRRVLGELEG